MRIEIDSELYAALGGQAGVEAIVDRLYLHVLANPKLAAFFVHSSLDKLKEHQRALLARVFGGSAAPTEHDLRDAHAGRGISNADFDRFLHHVADALAELAIDPVARDAAIARLLPFRADIVE